MIRKLCAMAILLALTSVGVATAQDLFEEAGHDLSHSSWLTVRLLPLILVALEGDDVVLVQSAMHPAKGFAMKIDGESAAADCKVTETKQESYTMATDSKDDWASASTSTATTYWATCQFAEGTTARAVEARNIVVQVAMTNGSTKAKPLSSKQLQKFQRLDQ